MISHGTILGGLATVPDLEAGLRAYTGSLGLRLAEQGVIAPDLAANWGCPAAAGARYATLYPQAGEDFAIRLVEQPLRPDFVPVTTFGWAAFELTVADVFALAESLDPADFQIIGPPKPVANMEPAFIPMQVLGPGREMLYCNQVLRDMPGFELPLARCKVDRAFIVVLAARDRAASLAWYAETLGLDISESYTIPYSMINKAFGLGDDYLTTITMLAKGRMPIIEVDDYPPAARERPCDQGGLPPGNALVSLAVEDLSACKADWIAPPQPYGGCFYAGRPSASVRGPSGELIELVQI